MFKNKLQMNLGLLSKHRQFLYGFAALWILFFHCSFTLPDKAWLAPLHRFKEHGNCGVDIFSLLSAMGLYYSFRKDECIRTFYQRRLARVFLPTFIVSAIFYGCLKGSLRYYIYKLAIMPYWLGKSGLWYAPYILAMYLIYPFLYKLQKRSPYWLIAPLALSLIFPLTSEIMPEKLYSIFGNCELAITRIPVFIVGCMLAPLIERKQRISVGWLFVALLGFIVLAEIYTWPLWRYSYIFLSFFLAMGLALLAEQFKNSAFLRTFYRLIAFMGGLSLELWLIHPRLLRATSLLPAYAENTSLYKLELFTILATIFLAVLLQFLCDLIIKRFAKTTYPISDSSN